MTSRYVHVYRGGYFMWGKFYSCLFFILFFSLTSHAAVRCEKLFEAQKFGQITPWFDHVQSYSKLAKKQSDVKDQCAFGTCHLYSYMSQFEQTYQAKTNKDIKISADYITAGWLYFVTNRVLRDENNKVRIQLGEVPIFSRDLFEEIGIIPDSAWTGSRKFYSRELAGKVISSLENIIERYKFLRNLETDSKKREELLRQFEIVIDKFFSDNIGTPPKKFVYAGKTYTPKQFQRKFFPELARDVLQLVFTKDQSEEGYLTPDGKFLFTDVNTMEKVIQELVDQNKDVYIGFEVDSQFIDHKTGIMSIAAFGYDPNHTPVPRSVRKRKFGGHAVLVVGYDKDPVTGKIIKWKIKNSWGEGAGDKGYYHMYADYFYNYIDAVLLYPEDVTNLNIRGVFPEQLEFDFPEPQQK